MAMVAEVGPGLHQEPEGPTRSPTGVASPEVHRQGAGSEAGQLGPEVP